jgi:hypothetical protein
LVVAVLVAQVLEMVCKALHLVLAVLVVQQAAVLVEVITALEVLAGLVVVLRMALLEVRQYLGKVMLAVLAQVQEAV